MSSSARSTQSYAKFSSVVPRANSSSPSSINVCRESRCEYKRTSLHAARDSTCASSGNGNYTHYTPVSFHRERIHREARRSKHGDRADFAPRELEKLAKIATPSYRQALRDVCIALVSQNEDDSTARACYSSVIASLGSSGRRDPFPETRRLGTLVPNGVPAIYLIGSPRVEWPGPAE